MGDLPKNRRPWKVAKVVKAADIETLAQEQPAVLAAIQERAQAIGLSVQRGTPVFYRVRAVLDANTCPTCRAAHDTPGPFAHVCEHLENGGACRCVLVRAEGWEDTPHG